MRVSLVAVLLLPAFAIGRGGDKKAAESQHFVVFCDQEDADTKRLSAADVQRAIEYFEEIHRRYVAMGLRTRSEGFWGHFQQPKTRIRIYDWAASGEKSDAKAFSERFEIHMRIEHWGDQSIFKSPLNVDDIRYLAAYEYFCCILREVYLPTNMPERYNWLKAASAAWVARLINPNSLATLDLEKHRDFLQN